MVEIKEVHEIRPKLTEVYPLGEFVPRTPAIADALQWGKELHAGQKRLSGEPYFETHCVWIANFIDHLVGIEAWVIAALLHDAVEDRGGSLEQIRERFPGKLGEEVAYIVDGVTKLSTPREGRSRELETLRKIAMFRDPGVFLVKLADKTHNIMTLEHMDEPRRRKKAAEAIRAYGRLAGILNCYTWRRWLEDMAFPFAYPEIYAGVKKKIDRDPRLEPEFLNRTLRQIANIMEKAGIEGRAEAIINGYWLTWQKLKRMARLRKTSLSSFSHVNDLVSFRAIIKEDDPKLCYQLLGEINHFLGPYLDQDRFDDYIAYPQLGYRAIQVTAWWPGKGSIEIAIATEEMENENQWGVVYNLNNNKNIDSYRTIEILTPSGGVRFVSEGSTVLDAVVAIQQDLLLDKMAGVEVNDRMARLSDKVKPGDVINVITCGQRIIPNEEWLNFCSRRTARLLRAVLATESLKRSAERGRQRVSELLKNYGILYLEDLAALDKDKISTLLGQMGSSSLEDLYTAVGGGAVTLEDLKNAFDDIAISKEQLGWTTIKLSATHDQNRPGALAQIASLISKYGGNFLRVVNDTFEDGGFSILMVASGITPENEAKLKQELKGFFIKFDPIEIV